MFVLRPSQQSQLKASGRNPEALLFSASIIENSPKTRNKTAHNFQGEGLAAKKIAFMIRSLIMNPGLGLRRNPDSNYLAFQAKLQNR
jgi:hypothetical protein